MNSHHVATRRRTRLEKHQVTSLQDVFNTNPFPDSNIRSLLARELALPEKTVQTWFQNRRSKAKKESEALPSKRKSNHNVSTQSTSRNDPSFQNHRHEATLTLEVQQQRISKRPRSSSKPEPKSSDLTGNHDAATRALSEGVQMADAAVKFQSNAFTDNVPIRCRQFVPLPVSVLRIGSWTRFAHASSHLHQIDCYCSLLDREFVWRVQAESHHFRIQVSFDKIHQLRLSQQIQVETGELVGQLDVTTSVPSVFSMWRFEQNPQWVRCGDFTEDEQASVHGVHILQGKYKAFQQALLELIALAPELASRSSVANSTDLQYAPPGLDLCRDFTVSPSATPELSSSAATVAIDSSSSAIIQA